MGPVSLSLTIGTAVVLAMAVYAAWKDFATHADLLGSSAILAVILEISLLARQPSPPSGIGNMIWLSIPDLVALAITGWYARTRFTWWKLVVCFTFLVDLLAHASVWHALSQGRDTTWAYKFTLNALGYVQILALGWPGARHVAIRIGDGAFHSRPTPVRARHGRDS